MLYYFAIKKRGSSCEVWGFNPALSGSEIKYLECVRNNGLDGYVHLMKVLSDFLVCPRNH